MNFPEIIDAAGLTESSTSRIHQTRHATPQWKLAPAITFGALRKSLAYSGEAKARLILVRFSVFSHDACVEKPNNDNYLCELSPHGYPLAHRTKAR